MNRDPATLKDITRACRDIAEFIRGMDRSEFDADKKTKSAVVRQLEIVGEASKRLSPEFRQTHSDKDWRSIAGMRYRLIHGYDAVDWDLVWFVATTETPQLEHWLRRFVDSADSP